MITPKAFGLAIAYFMQRANVTPADLAERLREAHPQFPTQQPKDKEVDPNLFPQPAFPMIYNSITVYHWLDREPPTDLLIANMIAYALGIPTAALYEKAESITHNPAEAQQNPEDSSDFSDSKQTNENQNGN